MKLSSVKAFVAVIESGSIHAAARSLGISQPALSKSLRVLEEELAAPLLTRSAHGVVATAYGKAFFLRARVVVSQLSKAEEDVAQLRGELEGKLTVCIAPASTLRLAPEAIRAFRTECPGVELHILEGVLPVVAEQIRDGHIDIAISPLWHEPPKAEFTVEQLLDLEMVVVARQGHPLATASSLEELRDADWLHMGAGGAVSLIIGRTFSAHGIAAPRLSVECRSLTTSVMLLQSSDLIGMLPRSIVECPTIREYLAAINVRESIAPNSLGMIYRSDSPLTRVAQIFATHIRRMAAHLHSERGNLPVASFRNGGMAIAALAQLGVSAQALGVDVSSMSPRD
ncbi:MAG TPA: LysR substrate-binding domain-containing protein [Rhodocyclaceae bacterium]|nr:LysR substrate-binding domain-containing protein [Rhodocyclaceae bacterium]